MIDLTYLQLTDSSRNHLTHHKLVRTPKTLSLVCLFCFTRLLTHVCVYEPPETKGHDGGIALLELSGGRGQW